MLLLFCILAATRATHVAYGVKLQYNTGVLAETTAKSYTEFKVVSSDKACVRHCYTLSYKYWARSSSSTCGCSQDGAMPSSAIMRSGNVDVMDYYGDGSELSGVTVRAFTLTSEVALSEAQRSFVSYKNVDK